MTAECKVCGEFPDCGSYCESCAIEGSRIQLMFEGNISNEKVDSILKERLGR